VNVVDTPLTADDKRLVNPALIEHARQRTESVNGRDNIELLTTRELEAELTIAAAEPKRRAPRLDAVLLELARRRGRRVAPSA
jgi:hypothetical protein